MQKKWELSQSFLWKKFTDLEIQNLLKLTILLYSLSSFDGIYKIKLAVEVCAYKTITQFLLTHKSYLFALRVKIVTGFISSVHVLKL